MITKKTIESIGFIKQVMGNFNEEAPISKSFYELYLTKLKKQGYIKGYNIEEFPYNVVIKM